ncbi:hypothetical protein [Leucothrix mucor]|uniref:hypothetical protein n=1 Tax=Leucothrix mucor TaxID=45248 RepID=UPI0003B32B78|nr:hypothetical protein [Leucothrix mucor]
MSVIQCSTSLKAMIIPACLSLGLVVLAMQQQSHIRAVEKDRQLILLKLNDIESRNRIVQSTDFAPATSDILAARTESASRHQPSAEYDSKISAIEVLLSEIQAQVIALQENQKLATYKESATTNEASSADKISREQQQLMNKENTERKEQLFVNRMLYEPIDTDWAMSTESKIKDSFDMILPNTEVGSIDTQCRSTLCQITVTATLASDESLFEFESELLLSVGQSLPNVFSFKKAGSVETEFVFTFYASPKSSDISLR